MRIKLEHIRESDPDLRNLLDDAAVLYGNIQKESLKQFNLRQQISQSGVTNMKHWEVAKLQKEYDKRKPILKMRWNQYNSYKRLIAAKYEIGYLKKLDAKRDSVIKKLATVQQIQDMHFGSDGTALAIHQATGINLETSQQLVLEIDKCQ